MEGDGRIPSHFHDPDSSTRRRLYFTVVPATTHTGVVTGRISTASTRAAIGHTGAMGATPGGRKDSGAVTASCASLHRPLGFRLRSRTCFLASSLAPRQLFNSLT